MRHLHVREGTFVKKNAPLITFDSGAVFRAPFSGTVTIANLQEGATALPGTSIMRLEDLENLYIEVALEQLVMRPKYIFADEPTGNLDSENAAVVMKKLRETNEAGTTICLVTHDRDFSKLADREIFLSDGKLLA